VEANENNGTNKTLVVITASASTTANISNA
jgi:hypothetical protein